MVSTGSGCSRNWRATAIASARARSIPCWRAWSGTAGCESVEPERSTAARRYRLTAEGRKVLTRLRQALAELTGEVGTTPRTGKRQK